MQIVFTFQPISAKPTELLKDIIGCLHGLGSSPFLITLLFAYFLQCLFLIAALNQEACKRAKGFDMLLAHTLPVKQAEALTICYLQCQNII